ncbi:hypothetical protein [Ensifer sp. 4252]|uniref:hypothetical protein n=1 Tax=Ensifer sp. 4252 TaxID=3373915 RepID=UPI003D208A66
MPSFDPTRRTALISTLFGTPHQAGSDRTSPFGKSIILADIMPSRPRFSLWLSDPSDEAAVRNQQTEKTNSDLRTSENTLAVLPEEFL